MKKTIKKIFSLIIVFCMACVGLISTPIVGAKAEDYVETSFGEGTFLITTTFNGSTYYLPATTTSSGPTAKSFTDVSEIGEEHLWTVTANGSNYYIQNNEGKYLYTTNTNNGVRVGGTANAWKYNTSANSFQDTETNRFLGIYNAQDWRCYTTVNQTNYKESSTSFKFYAVNAAAPSVTISGDNSYTQVGTPITLTAELANVSGEVAWASTNTDVAEVVDGVVTPIAMGKTTITAAVGEAVGEKEITVYPAENSEISIADALTVCQLTGTTNAPYVYSTTGVIASIDTAYSSTNDNITVTITDGTDSIQAYRMAGGDDLVVGTQITVTGTLVNYNGKTPEFVAGCTYEIVVDETAEEIKSALNAVESYMSLSYKYKETTKEEPIPSEVTDILNKATTDATSTTYVEWSGKTANSSAVYAGQSAGSNNSIQLRSDNNNSGIVTTKSGGKATKIIVEWNSNTASGRTLNVYGKNTEYSAATDLYSGDSSTQGTLLGTIVKGTSMELVIEGDYEYIGVRSASKAMYLTSIEITWETGSGGGTEMVTTLSGSEFRFRCGVDVGIESIENVTEYGICVTANGETVNYTNTAKSWANDENGMVYVILSLGDIINDTAKLKTEFTVQAYVVYDGVTYLSTSTKTYSVASIVEEYYELGYDVEHLYNHLVANNLIKEAA